MNEVRQLQLGDAIEIVDCDAIVNATAVENGQQFIVVGVHQDTPNTYAHIVIIDNDGDDLAINAHEYEAIKWVA